MTEPLTPALQTLFGMSELTRLLAKDPDSGDPTIYRGIWADADTPRPYVNVSYRSFPTETFGWRSGPMNFDIFTDGPSTRRAEAIRDQIVLALDSRTLQDGEDIYRFSEATDDGPAPVESDDAAHWSLVFNVSFWRRAFLLARFGDEP